MQHRWLYGLYSKPNTAVCRYDTGVISGALPYLRDDLLSAYKSDVSRRAPSRTSQERACNRQGACSLL